jgi:hypothetical protein
MRILPIVVFQLFVFASVAKAENCSEALIVDTYDEKSTLSSDWRLSQYLSDEQFQKMKQKAGVSGDVYGFPVKGDYSKYKEASQKRIQASDEKLTRDQAYNLLWTSLGDASLKAYEACLRDRKPNGLFLYPIKATKNEVELRIAYVPAPGSNAKPISLSWQGNVSGMKLPNKISPNATETRVVPRPSSGHNDILLALNGGGYTAGSVVITALPGPPPEPPQPGWTFRFTKVRDARHNIGTVGNVLLPDGYSIEQIYYLDVGDDHEFTFEVYGPSGRILNNQVYKGNGRTDWKSRTLEIVVDGKKLTYAFDGWNDGTSWFRYMWE